MDALSAVLETVRIRGSVYFWTSLAPPWGIEVPAYSRVVRYHLVLRGQCWIRVKGETAPIRLEAGDLVAIPHGRGHFLSHRPRTKCQALDRVFESVGYRGEGVLVVGSPDHGEATRLLCGHFTYDADEEHPLFRLLPPVIVVRSITGSPGSWLDGFVRYISNEVATNEPGIMAIVTRVSEILFIHTLRSFIAQDPERTTGWAGLFDPWIGPALARIHANPAEVRGLEDLARAVGVSRTRFAARFRRLMGVPPMTYAARWRLIQSRSELKNEALSISEVASRVGYRSEAAFHRAFRRAFGIGPGAFRQSTERARSK